MDTRKCRNCYVPFKPSRSDHWFCSGRCVAQFYRDHPNPEMIHADLPHDKPHVCEQCGQPYHVNDYAERGGKRTPKYCSGKCKQAAYRARNQTTQEQARRRYEQTWREETRQRSEQRQQYHQQTYHSKYKHALAVLSLSRNFTTDQLRKAYRDLAKKWHPDVNKSPLAEQMMKEINWAYDYLKK
jgi:DnaJ domain